MLSSRSIQAVRASLDGGYVRENHALNSGLVFLTISIAGGPFMGLLGTVVGVMITFAAIAATGEVNISAIAPGWQRRSSPRSRDCLSRSLRCSVTTTSFRG